MQLTKHDLNSQDFELLEKLDHQELIPFIRQNLKQRSKTAIIFNGLNLIFFLIGLGLFAFDVHRNQLSIGDWLFRYSLGFLLAFLLVPLHEYLHVWAYKSQGAKQTSLAANFKKFYFMALADGFVANAKQFRIIALTPFVVISLLCLLLMPFVPYVWFITLWGVLLCHAAMCSGDFGLLAFYELNKHKTIYTYDDVPNKLSYFYAAKENNSEVLERI